MNDYEITILCAEAMGLESHTIRHVVQRYSDSGIYVVDTLEDEGFSVYDPLTNDEQAMALVKRFRLEIVCPGESWRAANLDTTQAVWSKDLNRAICECVAYFQKSR